MPTARIRLATLLLVASQALSPIGAHAADLVVTLDGIAHAKGGLRVGLYDAPETFRKEDRSVAVLTAAAAPGRASVRFENLAPGRYAVMAYHDEDGDGGLDRFMGMIPTEGYALSNDPEVSGPPAFEECAFELPADGREIVVSLRY